MSYLYQARLAQDQTILHRVTACAAGEAINDPGYFAAFHAWKFSAQPGLADKYAAASAAHDADPDTVPPPGENETAITDADITEAVQAIAAEQTLTRN